MSVRKSVTEAFCHASAGRPERPAPVPGIALLPPTVAASQASESSKGAVFERSDMKTSKVTLFGVVLGAAVAAAVAGVVAQTRQAPERNDTPRSRVMMLDGRGGQLGVVVRDLDEAGLKGAAGATSGVRIDDVDQGSPAAKAGLKEGDIVVDVDGEHVRSARQFSRLIQETPDGRSVNLGVIRDGKRQSISVTPEARSFAFGFDGGMLDHDMGRELRDLGPRLRAEIEPRLRELEPQLREFRFNGPMNFDFDMMPGMTSPRSRLGVQLNELTPQLAEYFGVKDGGVLVSSITKDSAAEKAGLKAGDVITAVNGGRVRHTDDVVDELRDAKEGELTIGIVRDKKESTVKATIENPRTVRPGRPI
jgi:membrane-associated protease RseP (regulator of RpoE activity)